MIRVEPFITQSKMSAETITDYFVPFVHAATVRLPSGPRPASVKETLTHSLRKVYGNRSTEIGWVLRESIDVLEYPIGVLDMVELTADVVYKDVRFSGNRLKLAIGECVPCEVVDYFEAAGLRCHVNGFGHKIMEIHAFPSLDGVRPNVPVELSTIDCGTIVMVQILSQDINEAGMARASGIVVSLGKSPHDALDNAATLPEEMADSMNDNIFGPDVVRRESDKMRAKRQWKDDLEAETKMVELESDYENELSESENEEEEESELSEEDSVSEEEENSVTGEEDSVSEETEFDEESKK